MSNTAKKQLKRKRRKAKGQGAASGRTGPGLAFGVPLPGPLGMESLLAQIGRGLPGRAAAGETAIERAQDFIYQAAEARDRATALALARKALQISPDCADAYVMLAEAEADFSEARRLYEQAVAAGERALGKRAFEEDVGHFWGVLETRPYMRARAALASLLWERGEREAAVGHYRELLRLNPNDNQGNREILVGRLIELDLDAEADDLLARYDDDGSAWMVYARALLAFRRAGDTAASRARLKEAQAANPHVPAYLTGRKKLPRALPDYHGLGDDAEAVCYAMDGLAAWRGTPGALAWLSAAASARPV